MSMEDCFHLGIKALVRNDQGRVLLLEVNPAQLSGDRKSYWDLPGGRIQKGHTVLDTLQREVEEETGIKAIHDARQIGMVLSNIRIPVGDDSVGLILSIYECRIPKNAKIIISDEHVSFDWFSLEQAADLLAVKYPADFCLQIAELH